MDIARGLAIIWIILYHVKESDNELDYGNIFNSIMSHGHLGVQIFFLISGYSIYSYLASNRDILSGLNFLLKRLRRVYIPYWWSLIFAGVVVPITIVMLNYIKHAPSSIKWINYSVIDWIEVTTLIRVFFSDGWDLSVPFKPLCANWYIAIIVQIYLVIALSLSLRVHLHKTCLFLSFASMLTIIPAVKDIIPVGLFLPYWIEFASGMLLFYVIHQLGCYGYPSHKTRVILAFLLTCSFYFSIYHHGSACLFLSFRCVYRIYRLPLRLLNIRDFSGKKDCIHRQDIILTISNTHSTPLDYAA